ncbi:MAG: hypothetical protein LBV40_05650 [Methanomicrobiales archaeon]|jgi:hypothetical protein|nr:hypothetical protein [Methanomicrobiales archaeon]
MGTGIMAGIPIIFEPHDDRFRPHEGRKFDMENFSKGFFDNFDVSGEAGSKKIYTIKKDLLINNYKSFLAEFYDLIEEDFNKETDLTFDTIPSATNLDEFREVFSSDNRRNYVPFFETSYYDFSVLGCECKEYWLFYSGSYKAYIEVYSTLLHFERILSKSMSNPLANAIKFGIFG